MKMKNSWGLLPLLLLICTQLQAQNHTNSENQIIVDALAAFSNDFAPITVNGVQQYLHRSGKIWVDKVETTDHGLSAVVKNDAYGGLNAQGEVIADFKYDEIKIEVDYNSSNDEEVYYKFLIVKLNGKYGAISKEGRIICPPIYDDIRGINGEVVGMKKNGLWGWVSINNEEVVVEPQYDDVSESQGWQGGVDIVMAEKRGVANNAGKILLEPLNSTPRILNIDGLPYILFQKGEGYGLLDTTGIQILPPVYEALSAVMGSRLLRFKQIGKFGLANTAGVELTKPMFTEIDEAINGRIIVTNPKQGVIDLNGKIIVPLKYDAISVLNAKGNYIYNSRPGFSAIVDVTGGMSGMEKAKKSKHDYLPFHFRVGVAGKYGILDWAGKEILAPVYDQIRLRYADEKTWFLVKQSEKWGLMDILGKEALPLEYGFLGKKGVYAYGDANIPKVAENFLLVWQNEKMGLYNLSLRKLIAPPVDRRIYWNNKEFITLQKPDPAPDAKEYETLNALIRKDGTPVRDYQKGYLWYPVASDRLVKTIREYGKTVVQLTDLDGKVLYENEAWDFKDDWFSRLLVDLPEGESVPGVSFQKGLLKIRGGEGNLFVGKDGKETRFEKYGYVGDFWKGLAVAELKTANGKLVGIIDTKGKEVLPVIYENMGEVYVQTHLLKIKNGSNYGIINKKGEIVLPPVYDRIDIAHKDRYFRLTKDQKHGLATLEGELIVPKLYSYFKKSGYNNDDRIWPILVKDDGWFRYLNKDGSFLPIKAKSKIGY